jgi:tripartite-type tricarboxylate transporter receptor subunit TctC
MFERLPWTSTEVALTALPALTIVGQRNFGGFTMLRRQNSRRFLLASVASLLLAAGLPSASPALAQAANWPDKPVKVIVPYAPGGASDLIARPWADKLTQAFGQQFVVENRGGASGMIGLESVAKAAPDGYTIVMTPNSTICVLPHLRKVPYDPFKSFEPIARIGDTIGGMVVHPSVGVKTMKELVEYAKKNPGKLAYGSAGLGTSTQMRIETLKLKAGVDILHVPYRGSADALNDLLPGTVQMMSEIIVLPHVKAGKLVLLAMNHNARHPEFPDVPTMAEAGFPEAEVPIWYSAWAPAGTPKEIIEKLNAKIVEIAKTDDMKAKMLAISVSVPVQTPDELRAFHANDSQVNGDLIKAANIKIE